VPDKARAPLIIDADAVLPCSAALQGFQPVSGRNPQLIHPCRPSEHDQFAHGRRLNIDEAAHALAIEQRLGVWAFEGLNRHAKIAPNNNTIANRY